MVKAEYHEQEKQYGGSHKGETVQGGAVLTNNWYKSRSV